MNAALHSARQTLLVLGLLTVTLLSALFLGATYYAQRRSWSRDFAGPMHATPEWQPNRSYEPATEAALTLMGSVEPERLRYLRTRGIPIKFLTDAEMQAAGCSPGDWACTELGRAQIDVLASERFKAPELAAALSHELFHCEHHDPFTQHKVRPLISRVFLGDEEAEAHRASLKAARGLGVPMFGGDMEALGLDYVLWFWPLGTMAFCVFVLHVSCMYIVRRSLGLSRVAFAERRTKVWLELRRRCVPSRNVAGLLFCVILGGTACAQAHHDPLKVLTLFAPGPVTGQTDVIVRIVNVSLRTVNIAVPGGIDCGRVPGTASLEWAYKGDESNSRRAVQSVLTTCEGSNERPGRHLTWMHFAPGEYAEVRDTLRTALLEPGRYEVRAIYRAPAYSSDDRSQLRYIGIDTPDGEYKGERVSLTVGSDQP